MREGYVCDGTSDHVTLMNTSERINEVASWCVVSENEQEKAACCSLMVANIDYT